MHFLRSVLHEKTVRGKVVLEVGSKIHGEAPRSVVEPLGPSQYVGIDMEPGDGVDQVMRCENLIANLGRNFADVVICCGTLEHMKDWRFCLSNMILATKPDGLLLLTVPSPGFPRHEYPEDHWRFTADDFSQILHAAGLGPYVIRNDDEQPGIMVEAFKSKEWMDNHDLQWTNIEPQKAPK